MIDVKKMRELAADLIKGSVGRYKWYAMNSEETSYFMEFHCGHEADRWLAYRQKSRETWIEQEGIHIVKKLFQTELETNASAAANAILALCDHLEEAKKARKDAILDAERARDERNRVHVRLNAEWIEKTKALSERLEAAEKDAERWRALVKWIVENDGLSTHDFDFTYQPSGYNGSHFCWVELGWRHPQWEAPTEAQVNAAIDAAIAQRQGEGS